MRNGRAGGSAGREGRVKVARGRRAWLEGVGVEAMLGGWM